MLFEQQSETVLLEDVRDTRDTLYNYEMNMIYPRE